MTNNQEWFNKKYPKEITKEIEEEYEVFQGQLIIEGYLNLKDSYFHDVQKINKITLRNLPKLEACTIRDCGMQDLVIENCPQLKKLNVQQNLLTNLEFLVNLENLEELEVNGNSELIEILEPYQGNWKIYREFLNLQKQNQELESRYQGFKKFVKEEVLNPLDELGKEAERRGSFSEHGNTGELMLVTKEDIKKVSEINEKLETELTKSETKIQKLEKKLAEVEKRLTNAQEELESQQLALETLEKKLKKTPSDSELQEKVNKYKKKVKELKERETNLKVELGEAKATLRRAEDEVHHWRKRSSTPTQFNVSRLNLAIGGSANQVNQNIYQIQYNYEQPQKELDELKQKYQILETEDNSQSNFQELKKTILFLAAEQIFADTRQNTIKKIIATYQDLDESGQKFDKLKVVGGYVSNAKWLVDFIPAPGTGTVVNLLGQGISTVANIFKDNSLVKHAQEFKDYLIEDAKAILFLEETYQSLTNSQDNQSKISPLIIEILKLNQGQFSSYDIYKVGGVQREEKPTAEKMKIAIDLLTKNLEEFTQKLQQEKVQCAEKVKEIFAREEGELLQAELTELLERLSGQENKSEQGSTEQVSLEDKVQAKKGYLEQLKNFAREKLESRISVIPLVGKMAAKNRNKTFQSYLEELLDSQEKVVRGEVSFNEKLEKVKEKLKAKLTVEEINELCQTQIELTKLQLQMELESSREQKAQTQVPPERNN